MKNIIGAILLFVAVIAVLGLLAAWPIMVLWGAVADDFGIPTIGLGTAFQVGMLSSLLFKSSNAKVSSD